MKKYLALLALLVVALPAHADPVSLIGAAVAYFAGSQAIFLAVSAGLTVFSAYRARRAAAKAEQNAKNAYNASLQDRMITAVNESPPRRVVYGAGLYGGDVVAIFTSDKTNEDGSIKKDGYKHLVITCASHRVKSIKDLRIAGYMAGATAMSGWASASVFTQSSDFYKSQQYAGTARSVTLPTVAFGRLVGTGGWGPQIISITAQQGDSVVRRVPDGGWTLSGYNLTLPNTVDGVVIDATYTWVVAYTFAGGQALSKVYVSKFLGSDTQTADAYLSGLLPSYWTSNDRLRGLAGAVVTLDLTEPLFQSGIPEILFDLEGRDQIYDPRDSTTKYTTNPALIVDDWLRSTDWGFGVTPNTDWTIAAANACDVSTPYQESVSGSIVSRTGPRYTCNGSFTTADDKEGTLRNLLACMGGRVINSADWRILAGAWTPSVRTINDGDDMGPLQILQAGQSIDDLFNGVRGRYVPAGQSSAVDINPPYKNTTFVAADGQELWETVDMPFVDTSYRAVQLARVMVEVNRNGLTIGYPAKLKHWDLEVGQRVTVNNAEYDFVNKTFLIQNWDFTVDGAVLLTLIEDDSTAYDLADASIADPTPNTNLPNPNVVQKPTGVTTAAGTAELLRLNDGSIVPQVRVNWTSSDSYMQGGYFEVSWEAFLDDPGVIHTTTVDGATREVLLQGVSEYQTVIVRIVAVNVLGRRSDPTWNTQIVYGKTVAPATVAGLTATQVNNTVRITRTPSTELDWAYTLYDYSTTGGSPWTPIPLVSDRSGGVWNGPAIGALTIRARDVDTSGNVGAASTTTITTVINTDVNGGVLNQDPYCLDLTKWEIIGSGVTLNATTRSDAIGTNYIQSAAGVLNNRVFDYLQIPVSPNRVYNLSANIWAQSGNDRWTFIAVRMFRSDGHEYASGDLGGTSWGGTYGGYVFGGPPNAGVFTLFGADFGAGTARPLPSDVAYIRIGIWFSYNQAGTSSTTAQGAQFIRLLDVTGTPRTYRQSSDPAPVQDGSIWQNTSTGKSFIRVSGAWQPYVGTGSVDTNELANQSATSVTQDTYDLTGTVTPAGSTAYTLREVSVTPGSNCVIEFTARMDGSLQFDSGAQLWWALSVNGGAETTLAPFIPTGVSGSYYSGIGSVTVSFSATAGVPLYFRVKSARFNPGPNPQPGLSQMRVTQVKR